MSAYYTDHSIDIGHNLMDTQGGIYWMEGRGWQRANSFLGSGSTKSFQKRDKYIIYIHLLSPGQGDVILKSSKEESNSL